MTVMPDTASLETSSLTAREQHEALVSAAFSLYRAHLKLAALDAESRAAARIAAEALLAGRVDAVAIARASVDGGRAGVLELLGLSRHV
jgi:hypothetical protein